jgi:hypothetical protein
MSNSYADPDALNPQQERYLLKKNCGILMYGTPSDLWVTRLTDLKE